MLNDALTLVDKALTHSSAPLPNIELGRQTLESLKTKFNDMLQTKDWSKQTPFDYNELRLLYAAIHMYLVDLTIAGDDQLIPTCVQLCRQFSTIIESMPTKEVRDPEGNS